MVTSIPSGMLNLKKRFMIPPHDFLLSNIAHLNVLTQRKKLPQLNQLRH